MEITDIQVESTTDTPEAVAAATAGGTGEPAPAKPAPKPKPEPAPAPEPEAGDGDEPEPAEPEPEPEPAHRKRKGGFQRTIDRQASEIDDLRSTLAKRDAQLDELIKGLVTKPTEPKPADKQPPVSDEDPEPDVSKYEYGNRSLDYVRDHADWRMRRLQREMESKMAEAVSSVRSEVEETRKQETQQTERQRVMETWYGRVAEARERYQDRPEGERFDEVVDPSTPLSEAVSEAIINSEDGPDLLYYLCDNSEERERLNALNPILAVRELGRISARLEATPTEPQAQEPPAEPAPAPKAPEPKPVSKAPPPRKPVKSHEAADIRKDDRYYSEDASQEEFNQWREETRKRRGLV